ncbi:MAG: metallophosphoesterase [Lachnospiraceae bacterium]|nr:metallophosphoesterase [Lachnospiraceae bacterium]
MTGLICGAVLVCLSGFFGIMLYDTHRFITVETKLRSKKIKKGVTLVVLADLHNKSYGKDNCRLLKKINEIHPDMVLVAGDMLNAKPGADFSKTAVFLQKLAKEYKLLYGIGNHEHRLCLYPEVYGSMHEEYWQALQNKNITKLENQRVQFDEEGICVYGAQIGKEFYKRFKLKNMKETYLKRILGEPDKRYFNILLAHNPDYFESYAAWGADLVFSGHVHGGIVRLPFLGGVLSPACRLFPKYDGGIYKEKDSTMLLSRGLGSHTIPVRLFNPGELHAVYLQPDT